FIFSTMTRPFSPAKTYSASCAFESVPDKTTEPPCSAVSKRFGSAFPPCVKHDAARTTTAAGIKNTRQNIQKYYRFKPKSESRLLRRYGRIKIQPLAFSY